MPVLLIDAVDLGVNSKGINRVLEALVPRLREASEHVRIVTTQAGAVCLPVGGDLIVTGRMKQSAWEQWGLPKLGSSLGASSIYSHREAGALWGPPLVLHVPEDPEVRWSREPARDINEVARRAYSRTLMKLSLRRASVVAASVPSVASQLAQRYGIDDVITIPLAVEHARFAPTPSPAEDSIFHLGSADPRDRTPLVVSAYLLAASRAQLPPLVVAGSLGEELPKMIVRELSAHALNAEVRFLGWITDDVLADHYRNAMVVVQPSSDEGFGLQPLEALASGAPLLVSAGGAVREVVGDAACFTGDNRESVCEALLALVMAPKRRAVLRAAGPLRASAYTWETSASRVLQALALAAGSGNSRGG